jgi:hypothetical protein
MSPTQYGFMKKKGTRNIIDIFSGILVENGFKSKKNDAKIDVRTPFVRLNPKRWHFLYF